jgi:thiamine biosynthesis lipoprotein
MLRHAFRAMGTEMELLLETDTDGGRVLQTGEAELHRLESILSRFRPESELSRLNRQGTVEGSAELLEVTELALEARERTGGAFDPTVHEALVAAGYDRSFELLRGIGGAGDAPTACGGDVHVDRARGRIDLEPGFRLDLGGIAKGYAAERACQLMAPAGPCLANAGGDIAIRSVPATGVWPIGVETPAGTLTLGLEAGGLATSGRDRRAWSQAGEERHHLIDPSTCRPATGDLIRVTAVAYSAVEAEVASKAMFLAGADRAGPIAAREGWGGVLIRGDGRTDLVGALA